MDNSDFRQNGRWYVPALATDTCTGCAFADVEAGGLADPGCANTPRCDNVIFVRKEDAPAAATPEMDELFAQAPVADVSQRTVHRVVVALEEEALIERRLKPSNPKDAIGSTKLPLNLVPDSVRVLLAMAFAEGASKYGAYNWRVAGVRASIYLAAHGRHMMKYWNGEQCDPKTKVPHLASAMACLAIIEDARLCGKLTDDRPPACDIAQMIEEAEAVVLHLYTMHAALTPTHYTQLEHGKVALC